MKNCGKTVLLYIQNVGDPATWDLIGGMQANTFTINKEAVDVTDKQSAPWKTSADCGIRSATIAGNGIFDTGATELIRVLTSIFGVGGASAIQNFKIAFGTGGTPESVSGAFMITSFERTGEYNGVDTFSMSLESAGELTYTARVA